MTENEKREKLRAVDAEAVLAQIVTDLRPVGGPGGWFGNARVQRETLVALLETVRDQAATIARLEGELTSEGGRS